MKFDLKDAHLQITRVNLHLVRRQLTLLLVYSNTSCSPVIFEEVMNDELRDLKGVEVYQHDLTIDGSDKIAHEQ